MSAEQAQEQRELSEQAQEAKRLLEIGLDVEAFMRTPAGRYIQARANAELQEAQDALVECSPLDTTTITLHQVKARTAQRVLVYLGDIVTEGKNAERAFVALVDGQADGD